jgi:hypothetical protein
MAKFAISKYRLLMFNNQPIFIKQFLVGISVSVATGTWRSTMA